jgi:CBS domain-containing protein
MEDLLRIARKPPVTTHPRATVRQVCELMMEEKVGAVVILEDGHLVGIFSERDVVGRVVVPRRDPDTTLVAEVMTREVQTAQHGMTEDECVTLMHGGRFRHLPVVDSAGRVLAVISVRHLLRQRVDKLDLRNNELLGYLSTDGPGGD